MNTIHTTMNQLIDNILFPCVDDFLKFTETTNPVTLKDIYGIGFWLKLTLLDRRMFGYRFRCICHTLGFEYTGKKQNLANLYILNNQGTNYARHKIN
ncbi:MAG: hypothetical protein QM484_03300 [Woeseiaceae bacterium]